MAVEQLLILDFGFWILDRHSPNGLGITNYLNP